MNWCRSRFLEDLPEVTFTVTFNPEREVLPFRRRVLILADGAVYESAAVAIVNGEDCLHASAVELEGLERWPGWKAKPFLAWHNIRRNVEYALTRFGGRA